MRQAGATSDLRLKRILVLHKKLRTGSGFSAEQLKEACLEVDPDVTVRKIRSDLIFLRDELMAPIPTGHKYTGYFYDQPFSLFEGLGDTYSGMLNEVLALVRYMSKSRNEFSGLEDLLFRLEQRAGQVGAELNHTIQFEIPNYIGQKHLIQLHQAIRIKAFLWVDYKPFSLQEPVRLHVYPLLLKEYNSRWFLIVQEANKPLIQILALDRIEGFRETRIKFTGLQKLPSDYFDTIIGVSREKDSHGVETIVLVVSPFRINYLITKKIHSSQSEERLPDGFWKVTLQLEQNRELTALLLSFGSNVEVIEPLSLRKRLAEQHRLAWEKYISA